MNKPKRKKVKDIHVYLPPTLVKKLQRLANQECRSLSQQAVYLLKKWA